MFRPRTSIRPIANAGLLRLMGVAAIVALFGIGMSGFLSHYKFESALETAARSRMTVPAAAVREGIEAVLALGVPLAGASETPALLARERLTDGEIVEIGVLDTQGRTLFSTDPGRLGAPLDQPAADDGAVRMPLHNSFDLQLGEVVIRYSQASSLQALARMREQLLLIAVAGWALTMALAAAGLAVVSRRIAAPAESSRHGPQARLAATILVAVMSGMVGVTWATQDAFQAGLRPQLQRKAMVVGASIGELAGKALDHGLALPEMVGVRAHLAEVRGEHHELAYLAVRDASGAVLFDSGHAEEALGVEVPILRHGQQVGAVEAQIGAAYIQDILFESTLDLVVVFVVAMFLTRELLNTITGAGAGLGMPTSAGALTLARLRLPLFLFMLAEELTRAFLPGYARALIPAGSHVSPDILVGVPIVVFMTVVALGQPVLAGWSERAGHRRTMFWGAALGVAGLAGAALASGIVDFIAWRGVCGLGYGMVFVAGQGLVLEHTAPAERTRGFALFIGAIMVAAVCGPPIGGILADHVGPRWGFAAAAMTAAVAWIAVRGLPLDGARHPASAAAAPTRRDFLRLFGQRRFLWVTVLAALPAKLMLAGACFYLVPVYAIASGAPPSVAGRAMMLYAAVLVLVMPQATRWVERGVPLARLVGTGLCVSSLGGFAFVFAHGVAPVYLVTTLLGLGQGLSIAAQSSLLSHVCAAEIEAHGSGPVFGAYRLVERLGNASGPLVAGALSAWIGHVDAFVTMASLILVCGLAFLLMAGRRET
jgi:MFS family permease